MRTHQVSQTKSSAQKSNAPTSNALESRPFAPQSQPEETARRSLREPPKATQPTKETGNLLEIASRFSPPVERRPMPLQPKLAIGQPDDKYEQEADRVAKQVVQRINAPQIPQSHQQESLQRQEMLKDEDKLQMQPQLKIQRTTIPDDEDELQMKPMLQFKLGQGGMAASPEQESSIQRLRGSGQPLADTIRQPMEQAFGADFSGVRVHADAQSDELNRSIQAKAFTTGQDIFFRQGAYEPGNRGGQELIAHELTHVVQQNAGAVQPTRGKFNGHTVQSTTIMQRMIYEDHDTNAEADKEFFQELLNQEGVGAIGYFIERLQKDDPVNFSLLAYAQGRLIVRELYEYMGGDISTRANIYINGKLEQITPNRNVKHMITDWADNQLNAQKTDLTEVEPNLAKLIKELDNLLGKQLVTIWNRSLVDSEVKTIDDIDTFLSERKPWIAPTDKLVIQVVGTSGPCDPCKIRLRRLGTMLGAQYGQPYIEIWSYYGNKSQSFVRGGFLSTNGWKEDNVYPAHELTFWSQMGYKTKVKKHLVYSVQPPIL